MKRMIRRLPSPSMVVACLALGIALGGTSVAAIQALPKNSVGPKQIRKNAVTSPKVKNNALTGADINEGSLAKVRFAATADSAASANTANTANTANSANTANTAANANTVGGNTVRKFGVAVAPGAPAATVLDLGGLNISLSCPGGAIQLRANNTSGEGAQFRWDVHGPTGEFNNGYANFGNASNADLNNGDNIGSGSAHYIRANGGVVDVSYGWRNDNLQGIGVACRVFGSAIG